jgi:hypothetical protein
VAYLMVCLLFNLSPELSKIQVKSVLKTRPKFELCSLAYSNKIMALPEH